MKKLIALLILPGCTALPITDTVFKINETNYMKTPCIIDGAIVKKKPKVKNIESKNDYQNQ